MMKSWPKLILPAMMLLGVCGLLASCATTPDASSSVSEEVAADTASTYCSALAPEKVTAEQFETAPQWVRDYLIRAAEAFTVVCPD